MKLLGLEMDGKIPNFFFCYKTKQLYDTNIAPKKKTKTTGVIQNVGMKIVIGIKVIARINAQVCFRFLFVCFFL